MGLPFLVAELVRAPKLDVVNALAVGTRLSRAVPKNAPEGVRAAVERLHAALKSLRSAWKTRRVAPATVTARAQVLALVGRWSATTQWLQGWAKLPHDEVALAADAQSVLTEMFPEGTSLVTMERGALWIESGHALEVLKARRATVEALGGAVFLAQLQGAHAACGEALGMTTAPAQAPATVALTPLLDAATQAMAAYALQVIAATDADDDASVREATQCLDALIQLRKRGRRTKADASVADDPTGKPEVPVNVAPGNDTASTGRRVA